MNTIFVDADACPVRAEVEAVATRLKVAVIFVCNGGIRPPNNPFVSVKVVPDGPDLADLWIAETCGPGDVVVTADIPLADRCIKAGAQVLQHNGEVLGADNIGQRLATRDLMKDVRAADPFFKGGGASFTKADRSRFLQSLDRLLAAAKPRQ